MSTETTEEVKPVQRVHPKAMCEVCPLFGKSVAASQFPTGGGKAKAAVVSRSPGYHDAIAGRPFAGPSGNVLDHLLKMNGVKRDEILLTNVVLCGDGKEKGKVSPEAIKACDPRLRAELVDSQASLIIAAGSEAVNSLIGGGSIDSYRGYALDRSGKRTIATNNPALVLRDDSTFPNLVKDFKRAFNPMPVPTMPKVTLIENGSDARKLIEHLSKQTGSIACDIESRGGLTHKATLVCLQFAIDGESSYVLGERQGLWSDADFIENYLRPFFASNARSFIWHNGIFDTKILRHTYGIQARVDEDTLLLSYALDERGGVHELEYLLMEEFGWEYYTPPSVMSFKKTGELVPKKTQDSLRKEHGDNYKESEEYKKIEAYNYVALYKYAGYDAAGTYQLYSEYDGRAKRDGVHAKPYKETLLAAEEVLHSMETTGMPYDFHRAAEMLEKDVDPELATIEQQLRDLTEKPLLNPGSTKQMAVVYYDDYGIMHDMRSRPDKDRSTDESARKEIIDNRFIFAGEHAVEMIDGKMVKKPAEDAQIRRNTIQKIAEAHDRYSKLVKQAGTYLRGLIKEAELDPESRIYTTLPRHATVTARLASRGPNLQNVTRTKEGLPDIRGLFYALDGTVLVNADYSQAELRTIASLSGSKLLRKVYTDDLDLHDLLAERFYGKDFTYEERANSKNMNFGVFYWQSAATFQEKHDIPEDKAQAYIDWIKETFDDVFTWQNEEVLKFKQARDYSYVESPFGHRRRFYLITKENKNAVQREAVNFLPQNIAANLTLHACIKLHQEVDPRRARLCLTVHDSILAQVLESYVEEYNKICIQVMESRPAEILNWDLPFKADVGVGKTWATAK